MFVCQIMLFRIIDFYCFYIVESFLYYCSTYQLNNAEFNKLQGDNKICYFKKNLAYG